VLGQDGRDANFIADIASRVRKRSERNLSLLGHPHKLLAELTITAEDKDHATTPRRSPR
jgi:hypothetical protein